MKLQYDLSFRTIVLECNDKPLTSFDKELLERYREIHEKCYRQISRLRDAQEIFEPFTAKLLRLKGQLIPLELEFDAMKKKWMGSPPADIESLMDLTGEVNDYHDRLKNYLDMEKQFDDEMEAADVPYHAMQEEAGQLLDEYDNFFDFSDELYQHYDSYAIELCRFDDDRDEFCGYLDEIRKAAFFEIPGKRNAVMKQRNSFNDDEIKTLVKESSAFFKWFNDFFRNHTEIDPVN